MRPDASKGAARVESGRAMRKGSETIIKREGSLRVV